MPPQPPEALINPLIQVLRPFKFNRDLIEKIWAAIYHPTWGTDYNLTLTEAAAHGMNIVAAFTGYNWCGYCQALQHEVFDTGTFGLWRFNHNLLLLDIDLAAPPWVTPPPAEQQTLITKYSVTGYPTVLGLNPDGSERGRLVGYGPGTGAAAWIQAFENAAHLNTFCTSGECLRAAVATSRR